MHRHLARAITIVALLGPAAAQSPPLRGSPSNPNVSATGKVMPPTTGRAPVSGLRPSTETEMLKAQKATEERNKAWDLKTRRTLGTICNGC